jgi:hypothetical protein
MKAEELEIVERGSAQARRVGGLQSAPRLFASRRPERLDFGNVAVGTTTWLNVTFTNNTSSVVGMTGGGVSFPFGVDFDGNCFNVGVAPGAICSMAVSFTAARPSATHTLGVTDAENPTFVGDEPR